jgi:hypothetical protein
MFDLGHSLTLQGSVELVGFVPRAEIWHHLVVPNHSQLPFSMVQPARAAQGDALQNKQRLHQSAVRSAAG